MKPLFKTTIVVWSEFTEVDLVDLARAVVDHEDAFCSKQECVYVHIPEEDPDWVDTNIFKD